MSSQPISFQLASDVHLEFPLTLKTIPEFSPKAKLLCLLGDISTLAKIEQYENFLNKYTGQYEHILVLLGNHEYYSTNDYRQAKQKWRDFFAKFKNVTLLDKGSFEYNGITFLGCTLWSKCREENKAEVQKTLSDYKTIYIQDEVTSAVEPSTTSTGASGTTTTSPSAPPAAQGQKRKITVEDTNKWHEEDLKWLKEQLAIVKEQGKQCVVLTHHLPFRKKTSPPEQEKLPMNDGFASDLENLMDGTFLKVWCSGHSHHNYDFKVNGTRLVANQVGYYMRGERTGFNPDLVVTV